MCRDEWVGYVREKKRVGNEEHWEEVGRDMRSM